MKQELDEQLCKKYPKIFQNRNESEKVTAMCWGFECGDGWYWLINQLCEAIQGRIDANPHLKIHQPVAEQVKEKFGGLRFYVDGADEETYGMIELAEHLSYNICEQCGSTEDIGYTSGWITTLCKKCAGTIDSKRGWKQKKV